MTSPLPWRVKRIDTPGERCTLIVDASGNQVAVMEDRGVAGEMNANILIFAINWFYNHQGDILEELAEGD